MQIEELFKETVGACQICQGSGVEYLSPSTVKLCKCMKKYSFIVRSLNAGIPYKYVQDFAEFDKEPELKKKKFYFFFDDDQNAFELGMKFLVAGYNVASLDVSEMHRATFLDHYVILIYNLGLEDDKSSSNLLLRVLKHIDSEDKIGIFSFSFKSQKLQYLYPEEICQFIQKKR